MAYYNSNALSFLLVIVLFFFVHIEARESKFFTKAVIHYNTNTITNNAAVEPPSPSPSPSPSPLASPSEAPAPVESEGGYGLYGEGAKEFANTFDNSEGEFPAEEEFKEESVNKVNTYNNGFPNNFDPQAYVTVPQEDVKYSYDVPKLNAQIPEENLYEGINYNNNNEDNNNNNNNKGYSTNKYNENAYMREAQGMSDTRFMEKGKYYYVPKNERNYEGVRGNRGNYNEGYYGNTNGERSKYEFDTMEEYERQQGYPETDQGAYFP